MSSGSCWGYSLDVKQFACCGDIGEDHSLYSLFSEVGRAP